MSVFGMFDATCPQCRHRFGWSGAVIDRPPCPRCGHQIPVEDLISDATEIDCFRELMRERFDNPKSVSRRQAVRRAAGLSLRQAAKIMNVDPEVLVAIEAGQADPLHWFHLCLRETYGMDPEVI